MIQEIIVWLLFGGAVFYLGFFFYKQKNVKEGNEAGGCAGCGKMESLKDDPKNKVSG